MIRKFGGTSGVNDSLQGIDLGISSGSNVKSIQRGTFVDSTLFETKEITIASVDPTKCLVRHVGFTSSPPSNVMLYLINNTTVSFERIKPGNSYTAGQVAWEVIEFNNVKSFQKGVHLYAVGDTGPLLIPLSKINPLKSLFAVSFATNMPGMGVPHNIILDMDQLSIGNLSYNSDFITKVNWQVLEFN